MIFKKRPASGLAFQFWNIWAASSEFNKFTKLAKLPSLRKLICGSIEVEDDVDEDDDDDDVDDASAMLMLAISLLLVDEGDADFVVGIVILPCVAVGLLLAMSAFLTLLTTDFRVAEVKSVD